MAYPKIKTVTGSSTIRGLGAYAANDMLLDSTATGAAIAIQVGDHDGDSGYISQANLFLGGSAMTARITGFLFSVSPAGGTLMDNAANLHPVTADITSRNFIGQIDWVALSNQGSGDSHAIATVSTSGNLPLLYTCGSGTRNIYMVPATNDSVTCGTGMAIKVDFVTEQY